MNRSWRTCTYTVLGLWSLSGVAGISAQAQEPSANGLEIVELTGKLEMILGNQIKLKTEDGAEAVALVGDDTNFSYKGTADPTALSPGLMVRFTAPFDLSGTPQTPLAELEIFQPVRARRMSLEMQQRQTPGVYPVTEKGKPETAKGPATAGSQPSDKTANAKVAPSKPAQAKPNATNNPRDNTTKQNATKQNVAKANTAAMGGVQDYLVVGLLRAIQGDKLQIFAGNRPLILQADPGLQITVAVGDPLFCQTGDEIKLTGLKTPAGLIQAETIEVTGAKPLGSVDEKVAARRGRAGPRGKLGEKQEAGAKTDTPEKTKPK